MNGLFFGVVLVILFGALSGYRMGFLRVVYSLFSWILVFAFVTGTTPYITKYLEEQTSIQKNIQEKCLSYIEESAQKKLEVTEEEGDKKQQEATEQIQGITEGLGELGISLPDAVIDRFTDTAGRTADTVLESSGIYEEVAEGISHFIIEGIAFFIALIVVSILSQYLSGLLNLVAHLPVIHGINKTLGIFAGLLKGLVIVWVAFYMIALCCTSELGSQLLVYIKESEFLTFLYNNNIVLDIVMAFL